MSKNIQEISDHNVVKKSNDLIEASYKLSVEEQKLILIFVSLIKKTDKEFQKYRIKIKDIMNFLQIKNKGRYKMIEDIVDSLQTKLLHIKKGESRLKLNWIASSEYFDGQGIIEFEFSPKLKPYLLQLKDRFTIYQIKNIVQLKSEYSIRMYELLKQYEKIKERTISLTELKEILFIDKGKYERFSNFKQKVLKVAYKEINENTDIDFEFEEIKAGRKVEKIKFIIKSKKLATLDIYDSLQEVAVDTYNEKIIENDYIDELKKIIEEDLTNDELEALLNAANNDIEKIKEKYEIAKLSNYDNLMGFLISAILKDYKKPIKNEQQKLANKFHNFEQQTSKYDPEELEKAFRNNP